MQVADDVFEIGLAKVRQHPAIVDVGAPPHEAVPVGLAPELANESAQEEVLREAHARVRRHFEGAHFDEPKAAAATLGRKKFVYAELGAVGVAAGVNEEVAEDAVNDPWSRGGMDWWIGGLVDW